MKKSLIANIKAVHEALCNITEQYGVEYKLIWEYRYSPQFHRSYVFRLVTVFEGKKPIHNEYFKNDLEMMQYLLQEMSKYNK